MGSVKLLDQIQVTSLSKIPTPGGQVWHALKSTETNYQGFGEAYFSWVQPHFIKAWKQHLRMTMNLVVPIGKVRFVFCDLENLVFRIEEIGVNAYSRITVPPNIWFGFKGISDEPSLVFNLANIVHDPKEMRRKLTHDIPFNWK